jgi:hypothetical protein
MPAGGVADGVVEGLDEGLVEGLLEEPGDGLGAARAAGAVSERDNTVAEAISRDRLTLF